MSLKDRPTWQKVLLSVATLGVTITTCYWGYKGTRYLYDKYKNKNKPAEIIPPPVVEEKK